MRALVTGGAGFIGSNLVDALLARGAEVLVIDDFSTGREDNLTTAKKVGDKRLTVLRLDICSPDAHKAVQDFKPETVFHQAAQMNVRKSVAEPLFDADKNVLGTINMLDAARLAGVKTFMFASTGGAIYGEQETFPATESHRVRPESPYGVSKRCGELYMEYFSRTYGFRAVAMRYANVYGPRQHPKGEAGVVAIFSMRIRDGETLRVNGDGKQTRDFVFIGDVVNANMLALEKAPTGFSFFNVGTGIETDILQLVAAFPGGDKIKVEHGPGLAGEQMRSVIDYSKATRELGWKPQVKLAEGLRETLKSIS